MGSEIGFKTPAAALDRAALLKQAADLIDASYGHLGPGGQPAESAEGRLTRALGADEARLPAYPDVYRITDSDFLAQHKPPPVAVAELAQRYNFYWVRFPIGLRPQQHWAFNMIEVRVEFAADAPPHLRPKALRILPDKQFQEQLRANLSMEFKLNENLEFEATSGKMQVQAGGASAQATAGAGGALKTGAGAVFGPFQYGIKKAKIDHSAPGLEWVFWRLDGAEFFQEDAPELITILQVPKELTRCTISAELQASRYFSFGSAPWQKAIAQIPAALRRFFEDGMPLRDERLGMDAWDITPHL